MVAGLGAQAVLPLLRRRTGCPKQASCSHPAPASTRPVIRIGLRIGSNGVKSVRRTDGGVKKRTEPRCSRSNWDTMRARQARSVGRYASVPESSCCSPGSAATTCVRGQNRNTRRQSTREGQWQCPPLSDYSVRVQITLPSQNRRYNTKSLLPKQCDAAFCFTWWRSPLPNSTRHRQVHSRCVWCFRENR